MPDLPVPSFEGKTVRTIINNNDTWLPVQDLAAAWGVDRTTPNNIISRNREIFHGLTYYDGDVTSQAGLCVNEQGLYLLMGKVSASRLKNPAAKETVIRFQRWVPELVQKYRKGELAVFARQLSSGPTSWEIRECLRTAKVIAEEAGIEKNTVLAAALRKMGFEHYAALLPSPDLSERVSYLSAKDIGDRIGKTAHEVNIRLWQYLKLQEPDPINPKEYRLTLAGRDYGKEIPFEDMNNHHKGIMIRWRWKVMALFNYKEPAEA